MIDLNALDGIPVPPRYRALLADYARMHIELGQAVERGDDENRKRLERLTEQATRAFLREIADLTRLRG